MPIDVKEDKRGRQLTWGLNGYTAKRSFTSDVRDGGDEEDVRAALLAEGIYFNAIHPLSDTLICNNIEYDFSRFNLATSTASYTTSDSPFPDKSDPLKMLPTARYRGGWESLPTDHDEDNFALINSAGQSFAGATKNFRTRFLSIFVNAPFFDPELDLTFAGCCNSTPWNPVGIGVLDIGQALCLGIQPTGDLVKGGKFVALEFQFELRAGRNQVNFTANPPYLPNAVTGCWDGFQYVFLDQGGRGWYSSGGTKLPAEFVNDKNEKVGEVLLNGGGIPIVTGLKVSNGAAAPVSAVSPPTGSITAGIARAGTKPTSVFLTFRKTGLRDFNIFGF